MGAGPDVSGQLAGQQVLRQLLVLHTVEPLRHISASPGLFCLQMNFSTVPVGGLVGKCVGALDGLAVGKDDGALEGLAVGGAVGCLLGEDDGALEGLSVGLVVGEDVGVWVGDFEGRGVVGLSVG